MTPRTVITAVLTATTAVALAACGSSGSSSDKPAATTAAGPAPAAATATAQDGAALEQAVRAYSDAYFKPDPHAAYALLSARCQGQTPEATYSAVITTTAAAYGHQTITTLHVDQLSGDMGRVTYTYTVPKLNQVQQPWTREGGAWHYDAC